MNNKEKSNSEKQFQISFNSSEKIQCAVKASSAEVRIFNIKSLEEQKRKDLTERIIKTVKSF